MTFNPDAHHRRSTHLHGYDYSQNGAYFVTICSYKRECIFGDSADRGMKLNRPGEILVETCQNLSGHYPNVEMDLFVVMPNHMHAVILISDSVGAGFKPAPTANHGLPEIVRALKTFSAKSINKFRDTPGVPVWQRNYYEHVIRHEDDLNRIREYIEYNPLRWAEDEENPARINL